MTPLERYLQEMRTIRSAGAVAETAYYPALEELLSEVGRHLKPKVKCVIHPANRGAGLPDGGLFTDDQLRANAENPMQGGMPARGAIEAKGTADDAEKTARGEQVGKYWARYRQVLVTNFRDFLLVGSDVDGNQKTLETYHLAASEEEFWRSTMHPKKTAEALGEGFLEFLERVLRYQAPIAEPKDLAWFLGSYAREARARLERSDLDALAGIRTAMEEALGVRFDGKGHHHFFQSTLVQTLFYGVFAAWVLWDKSASTGAHFSRESAAKYLKVPILRKLFYLVAEPGQLEELRLDEVLDWACAVLNRVDRPSFFRTFDQGKAVQYFYEPFLEAFDPQLRKDLGVWYTPNEVVRYMVGRVDRVLREELGREDGLADPDVYVLDPCCGTGAFLVEVLHKIAETLQAKGGDALLAHDLKRAAVERVFGFEILPAPFVVAHLQIGLLLQALGAPLAGTKKERVGVFLTNALTGWEPPKTPKKLPFVELEEERDAADEVKREKKILVILGNPPYNSYAGIAAMDEERDLTNAYRTTRRAPAPQGQGLNDLYVRFFRMAERRIVEKTGQGIVCFISNYSWLDGLSYTGMRERYLDVFDRIYVDNLHGDRKISEYAPDGRTSETVFAMGGQSEGIKVGTAISLLARSGVGRPAEVLYRDWEQARAAERRAALVESLGHDQNPYSEMEPVLALGLPFKKRPLGSQYLDWPLLPELFPQSFPGVQSSRDDVVTDIDRRALVDRIEQYFDPTISDDAMARMAPRAMETTARFDASSARRYLLSRGIKRECFLRFVYRPFDVRWIYWEPETKLLDEKREEYFAQIAPKNLWIAAAQKNRRNFDPPAVVTGFACRHLIERGANLFPMTVTREASLLGSLSEPNVTDAGHRYIVGLGVDVRLLIAHAVAMTHSPAYREENTGGLAQDWPRIPLPASKERLTASAALGERLAALLDPEKPEPAESRALKGIGTISAVEGTLDPAAGDLEVRAGWGHAGKGGVTMPAKGRVTERPMTEAERAALPAGAVEILSETTYDVWLNERAYWRNVPKAVWEYTLGGYQVIKKWLSYREKPLLGRPLTVEEARYVAEVARRIAAILLMGPELDANYEVVKANTYDWKR